MPFYKGDDGDFMVTPKHTDVKTYSDTENDAEDEGPDDLNSQIADTGLYPHNSSIMPDWSIPTIKMGGTVKFSDRIVTWGDVDKLTLEELDGFTNITDMIPIGCDVEITIDKIYDRVINNFMKTWDAKSSLSAFAKLKNERLRDRFKLKLHDTMEKERSK